MEIYYTGHKQIISNINSIIKGQTKGDLTKEGFNQVFLLGKYLSEIKFDYIYLVISILKQIKFSLLEKNIIFEKSLREINIASLVGQSCENEIKIRNNPSNSYRFNKRMKMLKIIM